MSRRAATLLVAVCALTLLATFWLFRRSASVPEVAVAAEAEAVQTAAAPVRVRWTARLHLPAELRLEVEEAEVESAGEPAARLVALVDALLAARPAAPRSPLFPAGVRARKVLLGADGTAYVDLAAEEGGEPPGAGSTEELLRVYGVVHTVLDNLPEAERVVLLWNGVQRPSLGGHVDTGHALRWRPELAAP